LVYSKGCNDKCAKTTKAVLNNLCEEPLELCDVLGKSARGAYSTPPDSLLEQSTQIHHAWISFVSVHQMAPPATEVGDIQLHHTTHLSTPKRWKAELAWLDDL